MIKKSHLPIILIPFLLAGCSNAAFTKFIDPDLYEAAIKNDIIEPEVHSFLLKKYHWGKWYVKFSPFPNEEVSTYNITNVCSNSVEINPDDLTEEYNGGKYPIVPKFVLKYSAQDTLIAIDACIEKNLKETPLSLDSLSSLKNDPFYKEFKDTPSVKKLSEKIKSQKSISIKDSLELYKEVIIHHEKKINNNRDTKYNNLFNSL